MMIEKLYTINGVSIVIRSIIGDEMPRQDIYLLVIWTFILSLLIIPLFQNQAPILPKKGYGITSSWLDREAEACMIANIYMEARGESMKGLLAVAQVAMNRAKGDHSKLCEVIMAPKQFSWTIKGKVKLSDKNSLKRARYAAQRVMKGEVPDYTEGADHYHAHYVSPKWAKKSCIVKTTTIGSHTFYKCKHGRYRSS